MKYVLDPEQRAISAVSIYACKTPEIVQTLLSNNKVVGYAAPDQLIEPPNTKSELKELLTGGGLDMKIADEVKVAVLNLQNFKIGHCPYLVICGRPQRPDKVSEFNTQIVSDVQKFCCDTKRPAGVRILSAANDGVPSDQAFAMGGLLSYLAGDSNVATQTDTNHNLATHIIVVMVVVNLSSHV